MSFDGKHFAYLRQECFRNVSFIGIESFSTAGKIVNEHATFVKAR